jgi:hypothetical protein
MIRLPLTQGRYSSEFDDDTACAELSSIFVAAEYYDQHIKRLA